MPYDDIAAALLECIGGFSNVVTSSLCATRLRVTLRDADPVNYNALRSIKGVLGTVTRGKKNIEVVFGPNLVRSVYQAFSRLTGPNSDSGANGIAGRTTHTNGNLSVSITPETPGRPNLSEKPRGVAAGPKMLDDDDTNTLLEMLEGDLSQA